MSRPNLSQVVGLYLKGQATDVELQEAYTRRLSALPQKVVSWEMIRNIGNRLTRGMDRIKDKIDLDMVHMSNFVRGPVRDWAFENDYTGTWRRIKGLSGGWIALRDHDVRYLYWQSLRSGNSLVATKTKGQWTLAYVPSQEDPEYRGNYFRMYTSPEKVLNLQWLNRYKEKKK